MPLPVQQAFWWNYSAADPPAKPTPVFSRQGIDWFAYARYGPYDSPSILYVLVQLARVAYSPDPDLWTAAAIACGFDAAHLVQHSDENGKPGVVAFKKFGALTIYCCRGTNTLGQWISYANVQQVQANSVPGLVYKTFADLAVQQTNALYGDLFNDMVQLQPQERKVFMGHSLGGALMAVILKRLFFINAGRIPDVLVSFGCPRVGNTTYANADANRPHVRVGREDDPVCDAPPPIFYRRTLGGVGPSVPALYRHGPSIRVTLFKDKSAPERGNSDDSTNSQNLALLKTAATFGIADNGHRLRDYSSSLRPHAVVLAKADWGGAVYALDDTLNILSL